MRFSVSQRLLDTIIQYLMTRPYQEVAQLIDALQKDAEKIEEEKPAEKPE